MTAQLRSKSEQKAVSADELKKFNSYKESHKESGEFVVLHSFPEKVNKLNDLVKEGGPFDYSNLKSCTENIKLPTCNFNNGFQDQINDCEPSTAKRAKLLNGTPVYAIVSGKVECNEALKNHIEMIKPILRQAIEDMNKIKVWILLLIPRMEDGNNFGVSIQEEVLGEVRQIESEVASLLDQTSKYYMARGKLVTRIARYPHVDDYRSAIYDMDEKQFINLRLTVMEVRNHYATLHDLIVKNLEKIKTPRTSTAMESMY